MELWGDRDRVVKKVALCGGSGGSLIKTAAERGADVLVSGDLKYHDIRLAQAVGLALVCLLYTSVFHKFYGIGNSTFRGNSEAIVMFGLSTLGGVVFK